MHCKYNPFGRYNKPQHLSQDVVVLGKSPGHTYTSQKGPLKLFMVDVWDTGSDQIHIICVNKYNLKKRVDT